MSDVMETGKPAIYAVFHEGERSIMTNLNDVIVGEPIWAMQDKDETIRLALDCGDGGFIKMTVAQATEVRDTLSSILSEVNGTHEYCMNRVRVADLLIMASGRTEHSNTCATSLAPAEEPNVCDCAPKHAHVESGG